MRFRRLLGAVSGWRSLVIASLLFSNACAKEDAPAITSKKFKHEPMNIQYFENSDVIMFQDYETDTVYRSENAGANWDEVEDLPPGKSWSMYMHQFDAKRAYVLTPGGTHYKTSDQGKTWDKFYVGVEGTIFGGVLPLSFNAANPDKIIFNGMDCESIFCVERSLYTMDGFATDAKPLRGDTAGCYWAKSTKLFTTGQEDLDANRILCVTKGKYSDWEKDNRLLISDNFFQEENGIIQQFEPDLEPGRIVTGIINMRVIQKYLVAAASSENTDELALYVSDDTIKWHRAIFPHDHKLVEEAYTLLESTSYSIQIDVMTSRPSNPMGVLFSSNSNGTYFTRNIEHTNRDKNGNVDVEKVASVQGIILANTVQNWEEVEENTGVGKRVSSSISFDDGRTWQDLKIRDKDDKLHLHLVTEMVNIGRVLSSPAPGILMGVGNTGKYLKDFMDGDTYVSEDAGLTWTKALDGPHKYEFGDQGSVLVAIKIGETDVIQYSLDHGTSWTPVNLREGNMTADILTTTLDSTSLKFLLTGGKWGDDHVAEYFAMSINFEAMHEGKCADSDIETWYPRVDSGGNPTCLMGHKQFYRRRKKSSDCFMKQEFKDPVLEFEPCECTDVDFECDFNFVRDPNDHTKCVSSGALIIPEGECKTFDEDTIFKGSSGWRLIPGNECKRKDGKQKDDPMDRKCSDSAATPASGKITHTQFDFNSPLIDQKIYLERTESSTGDDETIVVRTGTKVYISGDHGKTWEKVKFETDGSKKVDVEYMIRHKYFNDVIYFLTTSKDVYYSIDRGNNIRKFGSGVPTYAHEDYDPMSFHPKHKDWIVWVGVNDKSCLTNSPEKNSDCHAEASITLDRGDHWKTLKRYVEKCVFIDDFAGQRRKDQDKLIYCMARKDESSSDIDNPWQLVSSNDFFTEESTVHFKNLVDFATESEFVVVATKEDGADLKASTSVDGSTFAEARFPPNFKVPEHRSAYTVLDSSTRALFMIVMVESSKDYKYGTIIKSNSNGTSYVLSLNAANQNNRGYVDFEKMYGIEGVALANIVANSETAIKDNVKKLKTVITHNDGADWAPVPPPGKDAGGKKFDCTTPSDRCSLHIHGFTERKDYSHTYSSQSAIGIMFGVGNVGEYLGEYAKADTFITTDAGITWKIAREGTYMWEFGDQGSILVLIKDNEPTDIVHYSLDEGNTWNSYPFSTEDAKFQIIDITTVPSDNSRNFVLWAITSTGVSAINLDFSGLTDKQCELDETGDEVLDYYLWTPKHPLQNDDCLFGHVAEYHRKKLDSECYNGRKIDRLHNIARNCSCTRQDFECDYNYFRESEGTCRLAPGAEPPSGAAVCAAPGTFKYHDPSGYRRIPLSTCTGDKEMDKTGDEHPCPGKEYEFYRNKGLSVIGLFVVIIIPMTAAAAAGWWVWRNLAGKFGQIRLGESATFDEAPYIKFPVMAISALVALAIALPALLAGIWHGISSLFGGRQTARYTTRSSFARGEDYAPVDEDEGELLGDESDEEV